MARIVVYLRGFFIRGFRFSVYHLSDEFYRADPDRNVYDIITHGVVLRNYFHSDYFTRPHVVAVPLGFTNGAYRRFLHPTI